MSLDRERVKRSFRQLSVGMPENWYYYQVGTRDSVPSNAR